MRSLARAAQRDDRQKNRQQSGTSAAKKILPAVQALSKRLRHDVLACAAPLQRPHNARFWNRAMSFFSSTTDDGDDGHRFADDLSRGLDDSSRAAPRPFAADDMPDAPLLPDGVDPTDLDGENAWPPESAAANDADSYWQLSRTPLTSLVFTLPLVLAYEGGVLLLGRGSPRNGADVWLRHLLDALGFGQYFLLPLLTVVGLLVWQHLAHDRWRLSLAVLPGMAAECVLWAVVLVGVARLQQSIWPFRPGTMQIWLLPLDTAPAALLQAGDQWQGVLARLIGYCGAGLYEEVLFRLLLLPAAVWALERLGCGTLAAACWALLLSSLLFSAAHYVGPLGDSFALYSFTFRTVAGLFFALLFLLRGFGIAAGTHFFYDLLVGLL
jgi:membrane protease YdiL (CAAX protease family)